MAQNHIVIVGFPWVFPTLDAAGILDIMIYDRHVSQLLIVNTDLTLQCQCNVTIDNPD